MAWAGSANPDKISLALCHSTSKIARLTAKPQQFQIWAASRDPWWMRRARPLCRAPDTEQRALSTLQRSRFCRVDKRSASTISLAAGTLLAAATQIWNCCKLHRFSDYDYDYDNDCIRCLTYF